MVLKKPDLEHNGKLKTIQPTGLCLLKDFHTQPDSMTCEKWERATLNQRVLSAVYFGVPQARRRVFIIGGLGRYPARDFLDDAAQLETLPITLVTEQIARFSSSSPIHTITAKFNRLQVSLGSEILVAEEDRWGQMVERERSTAAHGIPSGLDNENLYQYYAAGNAVVPAMAEWVAKKILKSYQE